MKETLSQTHNIIMMMSRLRLKFSDELKLVLSLSWKPASIYVCEKWKYRMWNGKFEEHFWRHAAMLMTKAVLSNMDWCSWNTEHICKDWLTSGVIHGCNSHLWGSVSGVFWAKPSLPFVWLPEDQRSHSSLNPHSEVHISTLKTPSEGYRDTGWTSGPERVLIRRCGGKTEEDA